jgi:hypothetical protein
MAKVKIQGPKEGCTLTLPIVGGTEEFRLYNRLKRRYLTECALRQRDASDDEPCETELGNSEIVRAGLLALDQLEPEDLLVVLAAAKKKKGRPEMKVTASQRDANIRSRKSDRRSPREFSTASQNPSLSRRLTSG